jgi:hypothetical protein
VQVRKAAICVRRKKEVDGFATDRRSKIEPSHERVDSTQIDSRKQTFMAEKKGRSLRAGP